MNISFASCSVRVAVSILFVATSCTRKPLASRNLISSASKVLPLFLTFGSATLPSNLAIAISSSFKLFGSKDSSYFEAGSFVGVATCFVDEHAAKRAITVKNLIIFIIFLK